MTRNIKRETIAHALEYMKTASATTQAAVKGLADMLSPSADRWLRNAISSLPRITRPSSAPPC